MNTRRLLARLGKHKTSKACLYIKRLSDVDLNVLQELIEKSVAHMREDIPLTGFSGRPCFVFGV